jgi:hypothetical protein
MSKTRDYETFQAEVNTVREKSYQEGYDAGTEKAQGFVLFDARQESYKAGYEDGYRIGLAELMEAYESGLRAAESAHKDGLKIR